MVGDIGRTQDHKALVGDLLLHVKMHQSYEDHVLALSSLDWDLLETSLSNDNAKKTFWINCYNAYFLILRRDKKIGKPWIYTQDLITIGGRALSLDNIEHGILRRHKVKVSLGYVANPFAARWIMKAEVAKLDPRIHFALNCGAASCPPIAFYIYKEIDKQLELATSSFLEGSVEIDKVNKTVYVSQLFKWYRADFGGRKGTLSFLSKYVHSDLTGYQIRFKDYDWSEDLDRFA